MILKLEAANDLGGHPQCGLDIGLLANAILAELRFCKIEDGQTTMLEGLMSWGVLQDAQAKRMA